MAVSLPNTGVGVLSCVATDVAVVVEAARKVLQDAARCQGECTTGTALQQLGAKVFLSRQADAAAGTGGGTGLPLVLDDRGASSSSAQVRAGAWSGVREGVVDGVLVREAATVGCTGVCGMPGPILGD